jgi:foldase protein PrsA
MKKIMTIVIIATVIAAGIIYYILDSQSYVARVGGQRIRNHEYIFFLRTQKQVTESEAGVTSEQEIRELWETTVDGEDPVAIVMNQALENAKEFKVQLIMADQAKFKLTDSEKKEINQYLDNWLQNEENRNYVTNGIGLTISQFKDIMMKSQLISRFSYDFMQKNSNADEVYVSDEEAREYYDMNRQNMDDVTVRHILISVDKNMNSGQKAEKEKLADELLRRIEQGENMTELVGEYSEDPAAKENNGEYTFKYSESYAQEFKDWAFNAKVGDTGIVETQFGYHIMRLEHRTSFEDKKELARSELKASKLNEYYLNKVRQWLNDPDFNLVKNEKVLSKITRKTFGK